nr:MAG TPA: hypothetical protein [Caudoviricetes sp.]
MGSSRKLRLYSFWSSMWFLSSSKVTSEEYSDR